MKMRERYSPRRIKRTAAKAAAAVVLAAAVLGAAAKELLLLTQLDGVVSEDIMLPAENNADSAALVNINTATVHHLQRLNGIGETTAQAVVEYREKHGGFASVGELVNVRGIGEKTLEKILDKITV